MPTFCIDLGNTTVHLAAIADGRAVWEHSVPTASVASTDSLEAAWDACQTAGHRPSGISFCSVVPRATEALRPRLLALGVPFFHLRHDTCPGLALNYPKPSEIGPDRLANAIGAQAYYGIPSIVVDMGTAVTFDIVTRHGYEGGVIAPGLAIMTRYLHEQTALLPALDPADLAVSSGIGKTTLEAMKLGVAVGFAGMIRALLERVREELRHGGHSDPRVIATGGSAGALPASWLPEITFDPHVTLLGLAEAHRRWTV